MTARTIRHLIVLASLGLVSACQETAAPPLDGLTAAAWSLPTPPHSAQPDFSAISDSEMLLSWVQEEAGNQRLQSSRFRDGAWSEPATIATAAYFGSSVDSPHVRVTADGTMWAQWLQKPAAGGHARDIVLARSADGGTSWSPPALVNLDATPTEHGFVAMWAVGRGELGVAWLDGRATAPSAHGAHHGASDSEPGATMVRAAVFDTGLARRAETAVDTMSCDCCHMDVTTTSTGPMLVYRDRTPAEIRDVVVSRLAPEGGWSAPRQVHADGWRMTACPVNGPAIASHGKAVAVAWYTGAGDAPSVRLAVSTDEGASFPSFVEVSNGPAVIGNVDVAMDGRGTWMLWLSESPKGPSLRLARLDRRTARLEQIELARLQVRGRGAGLPKLLLRSGRAYAVWTDAVDSVPQLHGAVIRHGRVD